MTDFYVLRVRGSAARPPGASRCSARKLASRSFPPPPPAVRAEPPLQGSWPSPPSVARALMAGAFIPKVLIARACGAAEKAGRRLIARACGAEVAARHGRSPLHAGGRPGKERVA